MTEGADGPDRAWTVTLLAAVERAEETLSASSSVYVEGLRDDLQTLKSELTRRLKGFDGPPPG